MAVLGREARDARELGREAAQKLDTELTRRERELTATPEERMDSTLGEIAASDQEFDQLSRTLGQPRADTPTDTPPERDGPDGPNGDARSGVT